MTEDLFLGIDVGTQGTKLVLVDATSRTVVARAAVAHGLIAGLPPGAAEQHPDTWIDAIRTGAAALFRERESDRARVAGIGVSGQQHGLVVVDDALRPLRAAKLWCDTSTAAEARALSARLGRHVPVGYTASKIAWLARAEPDTWARTSAVMLPHDYVNARLTGARFAESGDASGTGYFDVRARAWDEAACAAIDARLHAKLAPLVASDRIAARLSAEGAALVGLRAGIAVASGSGDNMMSALGAGVTRAGVVAISLGTSATVFARTAEPTIDPAGAIAPFLDATGAGLPLLCVMNATGVTEEVRRAFDRTHTDLATAALAIAPGNDGLVWLPYLAGERVPDLPHATGVIAGVRAGSLDAARLYRAAVEGVALNLAWGVERLRALGVAVESARLVGGASRNPLWQRVLADVLELAITPLAEAESAALGAALQALWVVRRERGDDVSADEIAREYVLPACDSIEPDRSTRAIYAEARDRFRELARSVYDAR